MDYCVEHGIQKEPGVLNESEREVYGVHNVDGTSTNSERRTAAYMVGYREEMSIHQAVW